MCSAFAFGMVAGITSKANERQVESMSAKEEMVFEDVKDFSRNAISPDPTKTDYQWWLNSKGQFGHVENWAASGKGFSFEFQFQEKDATKRKDMLITLFSDWGKNLTGSANKMYIWHYANGQMVTGRGGTNGDNVIGRIKLVDEVNEWYRFELMLVDVVPYAIAGNEALPLNGINFAWVNKDTGAYWNDLYVRKMKIIDRYTNDDPQNVQGKTALVRAKDTKIDFFNLPNWKTSGLGFYFEFQPISTSNKLVCQLAMQGQYNHSSGGVKYFNSTGINTGWQYLTNASGSYCTSTFGKVFDIGEGWYRYEVLVSDIKNVQTAANLQGYFPGITDADLAAATLNGLMIGWGADYGLKTIGTFGLLKNYSHEVTFIGGGKTTKVLANTFVDPMDAPEAPAGKHFTAWCENEDGTNPFDFTALLDRDVTLYACYTDHVYSEPEYVWDEDQCTAAAVCDCGYVLEETVTGTYVKDTNATCLDNETGHYVAVFTNAIFARQSTDPNSVEVLDTALGHNFGGEIAYFWDGESNQAMAGQVCLREGCDEVCVEIVTGTYVMDTAATCVTNEFGHYVFVFPTLGGRYVTEPNSVEVPNSTVDHIYGPVVYNWDGDQCTAVTHCVVCGLEVKETKQGTYVKDTDATCTRNETGHYEVTFNNTLLGSAASEPDTVVRENTAKGHTMEVKDARLDADRLHGDMTLVCKDDGTKVSLRGSVTKAIDNKANTVTYTLTAYFAGHQYSYSVTEDLPKQPANGCGGSIVAASGIIAMTSLLGAGLLVFKKRKEDK